MFFSIGFSVIGKSQLVVKEGERRTNRLDLNGVHSELAEVSEHLVHLDSGCEEDLVSVAVCN